MGILLFCTTSCAISQCSVSVLICMNSNLAQKYHVEISVVKLQNAGTVWYFHALFKAHEYQLEKDQKSFCEI